MRSDHLLTEDVVALGNCAFLIDPRSGALGGYHGNLVIAGGSGEYMGVFTHDVFLLQRLHKGMLEFIRDKITALGIHALLQGVLHFRRDGILAAGLVPECRAVFVGRASRLFVCLGNRSRLLGKGRRERTGQFRVHCFKAFHAADFLAEVGDVVFHRGVDGVVLLREKAVGRAVGFQKGSGCRQLLRPLVSQFDDCHSENYLLSFVKDSAAPSVH